MICHAVTDAILGAARAGDIGQHYPDTDPRWKGASSIAILEEVAALVRGLGLAVANVDVVVILERPKIGPYRGEIESRLAGAIGIDVSRVSVKGRRTRAWTLLAEARPSPPTPWLLTTTTCRLRLMTTTPTAT